MRFYAIVVLLAMLALLVGCAADDESVEQPVFSDDASTPDPSGQEEADDTQIAEQIDDITQIEQELTDEELDDLDDELADLDW